MTLIEIIIVIAIVAVVYTIALPNFGLKMATEVADQLGALTRDVRSAVDYAVLYKKNYRLVFHLNSGKYWLEANDDADFRMADNKAEKDLSAEEEKEKQEAFQLEFSKYEEMAKDVVKDPDSDLEIKPTSPVLKAKDKLKNAKWYKVDFAEWQGRSIGQYLIIKDMRAKHHSQPVTLEQADGHAYGMIYVSPSGYIEPAYLHIYYKGADESTVDASQQPYTLYTNPSMGAAGITSGLLEMDVTGAWEIED